MVFGFETSKSAKAEQIQARELAAALQRAQAVIEFEPDGTIITANDNFLKLMGYALDEIKGQHHHIFAEPAFASSPAYAEFWNRLRDGEVQSAQYKRIGKGGREVWIEGSYNPIPGPDGKPYKIVKFAIDITEQKLRNTDYEGQIAAIGKSQAVIAFTPQGEILTANENFLDALGYTLAEIKGKHHAMFVDPDYARSAEYKAFWDDLGRGEYQTAEYKRIGKNGREVWIQASYNPIIDEVGRVLKVVKYATDITARKRSVEALSASLLELAEGNLDARIDSEVHADFEPVRDAFNQTVDQLVDVINQLKQTSRGVKTATGEILAGANDLSERTTRQAATIEETSAAMEQLSLTVAENSKRAETARAKTDTASRTAEEGGEVMREANSAMERITQSSSKISKIIGMIDDIAFQTNLLALNASVEAARAGEAGKGFAVVAVEVRRLAQSAAEASSEVKALIEQSGEEVSNGSKLVAAAAEKLESILNAVRENAQLMEGISMQSREQAGSIEEINVAVRQMDEMIQHNAALVEETNAAIEQTESQASHLDEIVAVFRLAEEDPVAEERPAPVVRAVPKARPSAPPAPTRSFGSDGNAALDVEWAQF